MKKINTWVRNNKYKKVWHTDYVPEMLSNGVFPVVLPPHPPDICFSVCVWRGVGGGFLKVTDWWGGGRGGLDSSGTDFSNIPVG